VPRLCLDIGQPEIGEILMNDEQAGRKHGASCGLKAK
jgi:hypothetical protein